MRKISITALILLSLSFCNGLYSQNSEDSTSSKIIDNNLTFIVVDEQIRDVGVMMVCITDTSENCIANLQSGYVVRVYNKDGKEIYAGKTAGRDDMLKFPGPIKDAAWVTLTAFKPHVLNKYTGSLIYQDEPIFLKYVLTDE